MQKKQKLKANRDAEQRETNIEKIYTEGRREKYFDMNIKKYSVKIRRRDIIVRDREGERKREREREQIRRKIKKEEISERERERENERSGREKQKDGIETRNEMRKQY